MGNWFSGRVRLVEDGPFLRDRSLNALRDVLGHKTTTMTERYAHATDEGKRRAVEAIQSASPPYGLESDCHSFVTVDDEERVPESVSH
jgi:hypothetical protein